MGKNPAAKRPACGVKQIFKHEILNTSLKFFLRGSLFLCALGGLAGNSSAQNFNPIQSPGDWTAEKVVLEETIRAGNVEQKRDALFRIRNLETPDASRIAVPALNDKSEIVRATAAFSVVFLPRDEATNVLLPLLRDKKELVRRETALALGKTGNPNAMNPLLGVFQKDKITDVKNAAIVALGEIGNEAAISALTAILRNKSKKENSADEFLRRSAARSIGQIAQIIQTNKVEVLTPENFLPDQYNRIEKPKYPQLIEIFPTFRAAATVLIQVLQNSRESADARRESAFALGAIGDAAATPALQTNLTGEDYYLAEICREALRKIFVYANEKNAK